MKNAVEEVISGERSAAIVALEFNIKRTTLRRYIQKCKAAGDKGDMRFALKYNARKVFTEDHERLLAEFFITAASVNFGHSPSLPGVSLVSLQHRTTYLSQIIGYATVKLEKNGLLVL
jgi:hypothetical protein